MLHRGRFTDESLFNERSPGNLYREVLDPILLSNEVDKFT